MSTRLALLCSALVVAVLLATVLTATAGCQPSGQSAPGPMTAEQGSPSSGPASPPGQPPAPECNPRASLRPSGPLPAPGQMPAGSTMAHIVQRGVLIAGVNRDANPFAVRNSDLKWEGFDIDLVRDIAQEILGDREKVQFRPLNVADRVTAAKSGDVDLVVSTITITCKRRQDAEFSVVYFVAGQRVLVNRRSGIDGMDQLGGKRVCAGRGTTPVERIQNYPSKPIPVTVSATTDCLALLQVGDVDAVSTDDALLAGMAAQDPQTEIVGAKLSEEPYGVAMSRNAPDLVRLVNAVLERRTQDGRWQASYRQWLEKLLGPLPPPPKPQYRD